MTRPHGHARYAFPIALALTLAAAVLPERLLLVLEDVADVVAFPITPLRDGADRVAQWLRPPPPSDIDPSASLETLASERDGWRLRAQQATQRVRELEALLEQIQRLPVERFDRPLRTITARITGRNPSAQGRAVELNRGARHGVTVGAIGVHDGRHLVGQVSSVSSMRCDLVPVTTDLIPLIRGVVLPAGMAPEDAVQPIPVQLEQVGDGTLRGDVPRSAEVAPGDVLFLDDPAWPDTAQYMIVGVVESVAPRDEQPLRNSILVRPQRDLGRLASVVLIIEEPADGGEAAP